MQPVTIRKTIEIAAPPAQVWRYIGTAAGLRAWWGVAIELEERAGGYFEERGEHAGQPYRQCGEVITYMPPHQLAIRLESTPAGSATEEGMPVDDWPTRTEITITLTGTATETTVEIVHQALAERTVVASDASRAEPQTVQAAYGPTMTLPGASTVLATAVPMMNQPGRDTTLTLHALYSWRYQQEELWQQRFGMLSTLRTVSL